MELRDLRKSSSAASISSISNLASALDLKEAELLKSAKLKSKYEIKYKEKIDGSLRVVHNPSKLIRKVQSRINNRIFKDNSIVVWGSYLFGSIPNDDISRDYVNCARQHCGAKSVLKLDISSFFDNIHEELVYDIFKSFFKYPSDVSRILTEICTFEGRVPQGALTSSYLAAMALYDVEFGVVKRLNRKGLVYTRYVDDITVSSNKHDFDFSYPMRIIREMLYKKDLPTNSDKTQIEVLGTEGLKVHGLRINFSTVRLPKEEARKIRANVKRVEELAKEPGYRTSFAYRRDYNRCVGRVNKLERVGHSQADQLIRRLKKVQPLPSLKDISRCKGVVKRLQRDYAAIGHTNSYRVRYYRCQERLNILSRSFEKTTDDLRKKMLAIKPLCT